MVVPVEDVLDDELGQVQEFADHALELFLSNLPNIILAIAILAIGFFVGRSVSGLIIRACEKKSLDITLARFLGSLAKLSLVALFGVIAIRKLGIEISPFIALFGAGAFGLSLALQGPVSNYGSGIAIIITRPFKVDDTLSVHGLTGIVHEVNLGTTKLRTEDGQEITIPNRKILGEILTNSFQYMVVEGMVGVEYGSDPEKAIALVREAIASIDDIAEDKPPQVGIDSFGESSVDIGYRFWVKTANYYDLKYEANLRIFKAFKNAGVSIPFPQRDVTLISKTEF